MNDFYIGNPEAKILYTNTPLLSLRELCSKYEATGIGGSGVWTVDVASICKVMFGIIKDLDYNQDMVIPLIMNTINYTVLEEISHAMGAEHKPDKNFVTFFLNMHVIPKIQ